MLNIRTCLWIVILSIAIFLFSIGFILFHVSYFGSFIFEISKGMRAYVSITNFTIGICLIITMVLGIFVSLIAVRRLLLKNTGKLEPISYRQQFPKLLGLGELNVVVLGEGTGLTGLLSGLKTYTNNITAIFTKLEQNNGHIDHKSSESWQLEDLMGCFMALSESSHLKRLLMHTFQRGEGLKGYSFGKILFTTLIEIYGDITTSIAELHRILRIRGSIFSISASTDDPHSLECPNRKVIDALRGAVDAISNAHIVVVRFDSTPRDTRPVSLDHNIIHAVRSSNAVLIFLSTMEGGGVDEDELKNQLEMIDEHIGRTPDRVIVNLKLHNIDNTSKYPTTVEGQKGLTVSGRHIIYAISPVTLTPHLDLDRLARLIISQGTN